jgi:hypothetical protein
MAILGGTRALTTAVSMRIRARPRRTRVRYVVWLVPAVQLLVMMWIVWGHSANVPYWDEWENVLLLQRLRQGSLTWNDLWGLHGGAHRIVLPRIIDLFLVQVTSFNRQIEMSLDISVAVVGGWLLWQAARRTLGSRDLALMLLAPFSLAYLSLGQFADWFAPFQIAFILVVFGTACVVWAFSREVVTYWHLAAGITGAGIATLSALQGVLPWVAFAPVVLLRAGHRKAAIWTGCGALAWLAYFHNFPHQDVNVPLFWDLPYSLAYLGGPIAYPNAKLATLAGYLSLALLVGSLVIYRRAGGDLQRLLPWLGLAFFVLLCAQATALGRLFGLSQAIVSRYQAFSGLWWIAQLVIGAAAVQEVLRARHDPAGISHPRIAGPLALGWVGVSAFALSLTLAGLINANVVGTQQALIWQDAQRSHQHYVINYDSAPLQCLSWYLLPPAQVRDLASFVESQHMGVWARPGVGRIPAAQAPTYSASDCAVKPYHSFMD